MRTNIREEIEYLISRSYPTLENKKISITFWQNNNKFHPMACANFSRNEFILELNPLVKILDQKERIGLFAHELVHLEFYAKRRYIQNLLWLWNDLFQHSIVSYFIASNKKRLGDKHKKVDIEAIRRGYGENLIAYKRLIYQKLDKDKLKDYHRDYLSDKEVGEIKKNLISLD